MAWMEPPREFSMGSTARSARPSETARKAFPKVGHGSGSAPGCEASTACSL